MCEKVKGGDGGNNNNTTVNVSGGASAEEVRQIVKEEIAAALGEEGPLANLKGLNDEEKSRFLEKAQTMLSNLGIPPAQQTAIMDQLSEKMGLPPSSPYAQPYGWGTKSLGSSSPFAP